MTDEADKEQKHQGPGQPTLFREKYIEQAYKLTLLGATDKELAEFFEVTETTINNWKHAFPEFFESIKRGKIQADAEVAEKLFHRAKGYSHPEEKIFCHDGKVVIRAEITKHYPPDTGAAMAWLKNRRRKDWCESYDFTSAGEKIVPQIISFADATAASQASSKESKQESDVDPE